MATSQQTKTSPAEKKRLELNNWYQDLATQIMKSSQSGISRQAQVAAKTKLRDTYLGHPTVVQFELFFRAAVGDIVAHQELTLRKLEIEKLREKIKKLEKTAVEDKQENTSENSDVEKVETEADEAGGTTYFLHPKAGRIAQYKVQDPTQSSSEDLCHFQTPNGLSSIKEIYEPDEKEEETSSISEKRSESEEKENSEVKSSAKRSKESKSKPETPNDASLSSSSESESSSGSDSENEEENYQTHIDESSDSSLSSEEVEKAVKEMKKENKEDEVMTKLSEFLVSAGQEEGGELVNQMLTHVQSEIRKIRYQEEEKNAVQEKIETERKVPAKVAESEKRKKVKFEDEKQSQGSSCRKRKSDESQDSTEDEDASTTSLTIRNVSRLSRAVRARVSSSSDSSPSPPPNRRSAKYAETHKSVRILAKLTEDVKRMIQKGASYKEVEKKLAEDFKRKYKGIEFKHYIQRVQRQSVTHGYKNEHDYRRPHAHARQSGDTVDLRRVITSKLPRHYSNNYQKSYRPTRYPYPVEGSSYYNSNRSSHESKYQSSSSSKNYIRKYESSNYQAAIYSDSDYDTRVNRVYR